MARSDTELNNVFRSNGELEIFHRSSMDRNWIQSSTMLCIVELLTPDVLNYSILKATEVQTHRVTLLLTSQHQMYLEQLSSPSEQAINVLVTGKASCYIRIRFLNDGVGTLFKERFQELFMTDSRGNKRPAPPDMYGPTSPMHDPYGRNQFVAMPEFPQVYGQDMKHRMPSLGILRPSIHTDNTRAMFDGRDPRVPLNRDRSHVQYNPTAAQGFTREMLPNGLVQAQARVPPDNLRQLSGRDTYVPLNRDWAPPQFEAPASQGFVRLPPQNGPRVSPAEPLLPRDLTASAAPKDPKTDKLVSPDNIDPSFAARRRDRFQESSALESMLDSLSRSIEQGNISKACELVTQLSKVKAKITMIPIFDVETCEELEMIDLVVRVEDKIMSGGTFMLQINPKETTIAILKEKVFKLYHFPPDVQAWVIGRRLPRDHENLAALEVTSSGTVVYLYLKTAPQVGIRKKEKNPPEIEKIPVDEADATARGQVPSEHTAEENKNTQGNAPQMAQVPTPTSPNPITQGDAVQGPIIPTAPQDSPPKANPQTIGAFTNAAAAAATVFPPPLIGWTCSRCTLLNVPTRPGCEACGATRPEDYQVPENCYVPPKEQHRMMTEQYFDVLMQEAETKRKEKEKMEAVINYNRLLEAASQNAVPNPEPFDCMICYVPVERGEGVLLRECLHSFCRDCLKMTIMAAEDPEVACPFRDERYECKAQITAQEIMAILDPDEFTQYLHRSLAVAERKTDNSYHCQTPNCIGWCVYEDDVNWFTCQVCGKRNCLTCKAIHEGQNCKEYQEDLKVKASNDEAAKKTQDMLAKLLSKGDAMKCPQCSVVLQKKEGCDWMRCSMCKTEICWATKGPRWGPKGSGDTSGGCRCRVSGKKCAPSCKNCH